MSSKIAIINENKRRLEEINKPYNPITGEGSISIPRVEVRINESPVPRMFLPADFADTPFVRELSEIGFNGFAEKYLQSAIDEETRMNIWFSFSSERIKYDFEFFAYTCLVIAKKGGGKDIPFKLNRPQRRYLAYLEKLRLENKPIKIILCKSRQWGGSTLTQLYMLWIQLLHRRNWNSVICAHVKGPAQIIRGMLQKACDNLPLWATDGVSISTSPFEGSSNTRVINFGNGRYSVGSAEQPDNLRSEDISMAHLSEVGLWRDTKGKKPEDLVQSIFGSINDGPYTVSVLESTAKGVGNFFHREWLRAVRGDSNFTPVFVAWFMDDKNSTPIPQRDYASFIDSMTEYEYELFELGATLEAIAWYREKSKDMDAWRMKSEYPSSADEAFQSTGTGVFKRKYIENARCSCIDPLYYGDIVADGVKGKGAFAHLRFESCDSPQKDNVLKVWQKPDKYEYIDQYIVSVDVGGTSENADYSVIKVANRLPMLEVEGVPEVVAEWHGHIEHDLLIWKAAQIAEYYNHALLVVESNTLETEGTEGDNFEYVMDEIAQQYDNLYSRNMADHIKKNVPLLYGFHTNTKTKPMIIGNLRAALRDVLYIERSIDTTFELQTYELKPNGKEMGAVDGCHDDLVMATAILIYVCYNWRLPVKRASYVPSAKTRIVSEASI